MKPAIHSSILAETTHGRSQTGEAMPLKRLLGGLTMLAAAVALIAASAVPSHADRFRAAHSSAARRYDAQRENLLEQAAHVRHAVEHLDRDEFDPAELEAS